MMHRLSALSATLLVGWSAAAWGQAPAPAPTPAPSPAAAAAPAPVPTPVKFTLDVGVVNASGNTKVTTVNVGNSLEYRSKAFILSEFANVVYGRTGDSTTAEQVKAGAKIDHQIFLVLHGFVAGIYERNRFAGIDRRFEESAGFSLRMIDLPKDVWTFETGGAVNQKLNVAALKENFVSLRLATFIRHNFTKTSYFSQAVETLPNVKTKQDVVVNSESILVAPLTGPVSLRMSYVVRFDNLPEPGFQKTDRVLSSAIQITF